MGVDRGSAAGAVAPLSPAFLVTGATGFLGRHVVEALRRISPEARIAVLARDRRGWEGEAWTGALGGVDVIEGPLDPTDGWHDDPRLTGIAGVFHLAAIVSHSRADAEGTFRTNVQGTEAMVRVAARHGARLLLASTSGIVSCSPRPGEGAFEEGEPRERVVGSWPYYASKIEAERRSRALAAELGVELVIARPPVLLGPGDHRFRATSNVLRVLRGRLPFILRGGMHFADVRDVADAMVRAMLLDRPRPVYHMVGTVSTLDGFFRMVADAAGTRPTWRALPAWLLRVAARVNARLGSPLHVLPDPVLVEMAGHHWDHRSRYAEEELGYRSRAPQETLRDTVAWLREHHPELGGGSGGEAS
jgi:dihydroflavonol-4-reductase